MAKFNKAKLSDAKQGTPVVATKPTSAAAPARTYNGAVGYEYETLSQLFLLAVSNMVGEDTFYEKADARDQRFTQLIHQAVAEGHSPWLRRFFPWLRNQAHMRTAAVIGGVEATVAMGKHGITGGRQLIDSVLVRPDEPGEALAYYHKTYGRSFPKPMKRGVADAVTRLYTERNALKYDTASHDLRFGDVINLVHPTPGSFEQGDLFKWLLSRRRGQVDIPDSLTMIIANEALRRQAKSTPEVLMNTARLRTAGMTWEDTLSLGGKQVSKKDLWTAMIPEMGYMALLRNLRNFDQEGVTGEAILLAQHKLTSQAEVWRSRQLPMRFLSAYRNVPSSRWAQPLEVALDLCLQSVPEFPGRTLILIDTSGSMNSRMSGKSELKLWEAATVFGLALAARCQSADVVSFSGTSKVFPQVKGESLLKGIARFNSGYHIGGGTSTALAVSRWYKDHDRVVILTDEQANANSGVFNAVRQDRVAITFNLAGYKVGHAAVGTPFRITIGGLSDAAFTLLPALEGRAQGKWPF